MRADIVHIAEACLAQVGPQQAQPRLQGPPLLLRSERCVTSHHQKLAECCQIERWPTNAVPLRARGLVPARGVPQPRVMERLSRGLVLGCIVTKFCK